MKYTETTITPIYGDTAWKFSFETQNNQDVLRWLAELVVDANQFVDIAFNRDRTTCHVYMDEDHATMFKLRFE